MALGQNYAQKYSSVVDEKFRLGALTNGIDNYDYDWLGVEAVNVYTIPTVAMNNYNISATGSRYGTAAELQNDIQTLTLSRDRSFTFTIDRKQTDDTMGVMDAGAALARQIDEVIIPEIDTYKLAAVATGAPAANVITGAAAVSATDAYATFLAMTEKLDDGKVPQGGRVAYVTPSFYNFIKQDSGFIKTSDLSQEIVINGVVGEIDGVLIVKVPTSYMPAKTNAIITLMGSVPSPIKLTDYKVHDNPPGINGYLVEGRVRYDCFVLTNKAAAIAVSKNP